MWPEGSELSDQDVSSGELLEETVKDLLNGRLEVLKVVERLGPTLTSTVPEIRARGVRFLSDVLFRLPEDRLSDAQLTFIANFYIDRLKDNHNVVPAVLSGVLALLNMKNLPHDAALRICRTMFENVPCQQQVRTDRYIIYSILYKIASNRLEDVKPIEIEFVLGLILSMDGERDPRNLLFLFSILPTFLKTLNLGHVTEEMFEVMACYFPVDFNSPQDDSNAISRNDLADRLSICLCAVPSFAEFCIPLLLEKLESNLKLAKLDSLKLLKQSCSTFDATSFEGHLHGIWQVLHKEMSQDSDVETSNCAHESLSELVNKLFSSENTSIAESFMKEIFITVQSSLVETKIKSRFDMQLKILLTVARSSEKSCVYTVKNMNLQIRAHFKVADDHVFSISILKYFIGLFDICKHWDVVANLADDFKFLTETIMSTNNCGNLEVKLCGYRTLSEVAELVSPEESVIFQDFICYNINHEPDERIFEATKSCLLSLARKHPYSYEQFIRELLTLEAVKSNRMLLNRKVQCLCFIGSIEMFAHPIMENILNFITSNESETETTAVVVDSIISALKNKALFSDVRCSNIETQHNFIERIVDWVMEHKIYTINHLRMRVSQLIILMIRTLSCEKQYELYERLLNKYKNEFSNGDHASIIILEALLNSSRDELNFNDINWIISTAFDISMNETCDEVRQKACMLLANIFNKYINNANIINEYQIMKGGILKLEGDNLCRSNSISLISWLTKSLIHNGHSDAHSWFLKIVEFINCEKWGSHAAKGISQIMSDDKTSLSKESFCKINYFYRQKVFQWFLQCCDGESYSNNAARLQAWSFIIKSVPKSVLVMELAKISNIIVDCLNLTDPEVLLTTLEIVSYLIQNRKSVCTIQTLLPRCLNLCGKNYPARVRAASLQCIFDIAHHCSTPQLLSHKQDIVIELSQFLDDPKRVVRSYAVKARTRWFLVGSPGEDKDK